MFNNITHEPVSLGAPNISAVKRRDFVLSEPQDIHRDMSVVIQRLARVRPNWQFISRTECTQNNPSNGRHFSFAVFEQGEELGTIRWSWTRGSNRGYEITNRRISDIRPRTRCIRTTDSDRAVRTVLTNFRPRNVAEAIIDCSEKVRSTLGEELGKHNRIISEFEVSIRKPALQFTIENWDAFRKFLPPTYRATGFVDRKDEMVGHYTSVKELNKLQSLGVMVILRGADYVLANIDGSTTRILSSDELADKLKRSIGILKLAEDKQYIAGVGIRINEATFFLASEDEGVTP